MPWSSAAAILRARSLASAARSVRPDGTVMTASMRPRRRPSRRVRSSPGTNTNSENGFFSASASLTCSPGLALPLGTCWSALRISVLTSSPGSARTTPMRASALSWLVNTSPKITMNMIGNATVRNNARRLERNSVRFAR